MNKNLYRAISFALVACLFFTSVNVEAYASSFFQVYSTENKTDTSSYDLSGDETKKVYDGTYSVSIENTEFSSEEGYHAILSGETEDIISDADKEKIYLNNSTSSFIPLKYSSVEKNHVTKIKNQRQYNLCWAFAAVAAVESAILSKNILGEDAKTLKDTLDLSEKDFAYYFYNRKGQNDILKNTENDYTEIGISGSNWNMLGGNDMMSVWYMLNWEAPSNETTDNSSETNSTLNSEFEKDLDSKNYFDCDVHIQNAKFFKKTEAEKIKQHIMEYGAVMASYSASSISVEQNAMYQFNPNKTSANHAIVIVGWDDTISRDKFINKDNIKPSIDGAWLIKNSWGKEVGGELEGYQWISYDDNTLGEFIGIDCESKYNYDNIFYYDGATGCDHTSIEYKTTSYDTNFYNIFTNNTKYTQNIKAVGIGISDLGVDDGSPAECNIEIYKNPTPGECESGEKMLISSIKKNFTENGYHTVKLNSSVYIKPGETFEVLFHFSTPTSIYVDQETSKNQQNWFRCNVGEKEGAKISYVNTTDMSTLSKHPTLRIKAYSNNVINFDDLKVGDITDYVYDGTYHEPDPDVYIGDIKLIRDRDYKITYGNNINAGEATLKIEGIGDCVGATERKFKINKRNVTITAVSTKIAKGRMIEKYKYLVDGLIDGENFPENKIPTVSSNATVSSNCGTYPLKVIVDKNALGENYIINAVDGILSIVDVDVKYVVTFENNGIGKSIDCQLIDIGGFVKEPNIQNVEGYIFKGWYCDNKFEKKWNFDEDYIIGYDETLYAKWEELKYNIIYNKNASDVNYEYDKVNEISYFDSFVVPDGREYYRNGYFFSGWSLKSDSKEVFVKPGESVTGKKFGIKEQNENVNLYAVWKRSVLNPYTDIKAGEVEYGTVISLLCDTEGASIYYLTIPQDSKESKSNIIPNRDSILYQDKITITSNVTIKAIAVKDDYEDSEVITFEFELKRDKGDITEDDLDRYCKDGIPHGIWVAGGPYYISEDDNKSIVYNGKKQVFDINVYDYDVKLIPGKDYKATFKNNKRACEDVNDSKSPRIIIKGKGAYSGMYIYKFPIEKISLDTASENSKTTYCAPEKAGKQVNKIIMDVLSSDGKKIKQNKDYSVETYADEGMTETVTPTKEGEYYVKIQGKGNYKGSLYSKYYIFNDGMQMKDAVVKGFEKQTKYDGGNEVSQNKLSVSIKGIGELKEGEDYSVTYFNNAEIGMAKVILTAIPSDKKIYGSKILTYKIGGISIKSCKIAKFWDKEDPDEEYPFIYEGDEITLPIEITGKNINGEETDLEENVDYVVSYKNNINAGKATVTITGIGNYYGTIKKTFVIKKANINDCSIEYMSSAPFEKGGTKPDVKVYCGSTVLERDVDYEVIYKNNKKVVTSLTPNSKKNPTISIKGKGNYTGVFKPMSGKELNFVITKRDMADKEHPLCVDIDDVYVNANMKSVPVIYENNGNELIKGVDYSDDFKYVLSGTDTVIDENSNLPAGTLIDLCITGKGDYYGTLIVTYKVTEKTISNAKIHLKNEQYYNRNGAKLSAYDIIVEVDGGFLNAGTDYEIIRCTNNTEIGKAEAVIRGRGEYGGSIKYSYNIEKRDIAN